MRISPSRWARALMLETRPLGPGRLARCREIRSWCLYRPRTWRHGMGPAATSALGYSCADRNRLGDVAQLARAPALQAGGHGFESRHLHSKCVVQPALDRSVESAESAMGVIGVVALPTASSPNNVFSAGSGERGSRKSGSWKLSSILLRSGGHHHHETSPNRNCEPSLKAAVEGDRVGSPGSRPPGRLERNGLGSTATNPAGASDFRDCDARQWTSHGVMVRKLEHSQRRIFG